MKNNFSKESLDFWKILNLAERKKIEKGIKQLNQGKGKSYKEIIKSI
tara:strand:- start:171 stop:311 length:141 start_codon:yes stop_codon:yes gene_type:complete